MFFFFFNDTATTEIYTLSLHDALPIWRVRSLIPRGRYLPFGSCPCRSRGFDIWRPPAVQGHGGFATPTAEAAPPTSLSPDFPELSPHPPAANAVGIPSPACGRGVFCGGAPGTPSP